MDVGTIVHSLNTSRTEPPEQKLDGGDLVSDQLLRLLTLINYVTITTTISVLGIIFNIINLIVFLKLGFSDSVNITLVGLALADACSLLPLVWMGLCYNPLIVQRYRYMDFVSIQHTTAGWPHIAFNRITGWLTVFITFERYLCVAYPLKVKSIITSRRTVIIVVIIFTVTIISVIPVYISSYIGLYLSQNTTTVRLIYIPNGFAIESFTLYFAAFSQIISFCAVVIFTFLLVHTFLEKAKWRNNTSNSSRNETMANRDVSIVKMIISISVIFIICFMPITFNVIGTMTIDGYTFSGRYKNLFQACSAFFFTFEAINSTVNIFVYLKMSTKYRLAFRKLFGLGGVPQ